MFTKLDDKSKVSDESSEETSDDEETIWKRGVV